jgi:hypothetical protein
MDPLRDFLEAVRAQGLALGNFRGLLHALVGRRITTAEGAAVSAGLTWREVAALLKRLRWDREAVRELGLDPATLPPRDRQRYWYTAIAQADLAAAGAAADELMEPLQRLGYVVAGAPRPAEKPAAKKRPPRNRTGGRQPPEGTKGTGS